METQHRREPLGEGLPHLHPRAMGCDVLNQTGARLMAQNQRGLRVEPQAVAGAISLLSERWLDNTSLREG